MNVLRMRVKPRPTSGMTEIAFYSCPDVKRDPVKTLAYVQKVADERHIACDYELVSELEYFAIRGAREWMMSEPGDFEADHLFRIKLVRSGFATSINKITAITMMDDGHTLKVATDAEVLVIDTEKGTAIIDPIMRADHTLRGSEP